MKRLFHTLLWTLVLAVSMRASAHRADSSIVFENGYRYRPYKSYISVLPLFSGVFFRNVPDQVNVLLLGLRGGYGWKRDEWLVGADLGYQHIFIQRYNDANRSDLRAYTEYHLLQKHRFVPLAGIQPNLMLWQYKPEYSGFQFFNDELDGKSRTHFIPGLYAYLGCDLTFKRRYHILMDIGYSWKFTNKQGRIPDGDVPIQLNLDFRIPRLARFGILRK